MIYTFVYDMLLVKHSFKKVIIAHLDDLITRQIH